jgi:VWFA-related protein
MRFRSLLVGTALVLAAAAVSATQTPQYRSGTNTVSIYATVVDAAGRLVTDLSRADFDVFDNGVRQPLSLFASDVQPITIVVMLDRSGSMKPHFARVQDAAETFVGDLLGGDRARIGSFADRIQIGPETFTSDHDALLHVIRDEMQPPGLTPLWGAAAAAMDALRGEEGRRVVLMFTDGRDTPGVGQNVSFAAVRSRSQAEDVMVYAIGFTEECAPGDTSPRWPLPFRSGNGNGPVRFQRMPGGGGGRGGPGRFPGPGGGGRPGVPMPGAPPGPGVPIWPPPVTTPRPIGPTVDTCVSSGPDPELRELAALGGGGYFELRAADDLRSTFARIADELHHQYLLAFTAGKIDNAVHTLDVRVRRADLRVRARRSYVAD